MRINVTRSSLPDFEEFCREIQGLWDSRWLTNMGDKHQALEEALEAYLGIPHVTLFTNGHLALETALAALHLPKGGEVITTPYTFVSTTHAISRNGLVPVFADIKPEDYTLDPEKVRALITEKTVAILPVHVYGRLCDVEAFEALGKAYNLPVVYDAAHAFGVTKDGVSSACFGDMAMYSFHATKVFHTIEGGALAYRDDALVQLLNDLKNFGIRGPEEVAYIGGNAKMSEFQAAMGLCNLRRLEEEIQKRGRVVEQYNARLAGREGIILAGTQPGVSPNHAYYPVVFDGYKYSRDEVFGRLAAQDIVPRKYFYPLTNDSECYRSLPTGGKDKTPLAAHVADRVLTLPLYADLAPEDVDRICDIILK
ncbi:MAG: DegT/DnrJ/EryC1/StrS family aminotransferase [Lachnospiraceae bacterium]|nr:DegT/DnrJ/EryC1/StrS family aminotransferase [Lachnospiraceae bacterium]